MNDGFNGLADFGVLYADDDFCADVCDDLVHSEPDAIFDCGCVFPDEEEYDDRSDLEQASDWLVSAGWGTDEDYGYIDEGW